jgi:hypothetical protein
VRDPDATFAGIYASQGVPARIREIQFFDLTVGDRADRIRGDLEAPRD